MFRENVVATCYTFRECNFGTYNLLLLRGVRQSLEMVRKAKIIFIKSYKMVQKGFYTGKYEQLKYTPLSCACSTTGNPLLSLLLLARLLGK